MIILISNQKGGVGKSTIATNFSAVLAQQGKDVLILDADRQLSASRWAHERKLTQDKAPKIVCVQQSGSIDDVLEDLAKRYEYVIVDAAGRDSEEMRSALSVCDIALFPFRPSQLDLDTLPTMDALVRQFRRVNPKIVANAVLSIAPTNTKIKEIEQSIMAIGGCSEIALLDTIIHDRKIYRDAYSEGLGVVEMSGRSDSEIASRKESLALVAEVLSGYQIV
jgi:chromosome partitioning protein